jgi:hypothetical protein
MKLLDTKWKKNTSRLEMECQSTGRVSKRCMSVWRPRVRMYGGLRVLYECMKTWRWCTEVWRPGCGVWMFEDLEVKWYRYMTYEDLEEVLRMRIRMLLGLLDPEPSVRYGSSGSRSFYHQAKIVRKPLIPTVLWLFLLLIIFEKWCKCTFKK